jgi:hypothetical protein
VGCVHHRCLVLQLCGGLSSAHSACALWLPDRSLPAAVGAVVAVVAAVGVAVTAVVAESSVSGGASHSVA